MAMSLAKNCLGQFQSKVSNGHVSSMARTLFTSPAHYKSRSPDVCLSVDKKMILCWHPEPDFPYEYTQPVPRDKTQLEKGDSVLKIQYLVDEKLKNRPEGPTLAELSQILYVPRHALKRYPRHEKKMEMIKKVPKDREYL
uniref:Large ribosomal subunit protein mL42 n=1 Tax=Arion vulgaris TaxID=1028688 RepID=A0A0B6YXE2_9EUPU